ncbi:MAG: PilZ domain-containing protein [Candidatus Omnitrophica bacterium]|nr:PilZ domain-containing protein [Candidatus Omnitrophota bacterium]MBU4479300.1 PilZ domain-containing protein [Candidatus Omnitrophota bacterium]MCG2704009.1 PilZ domain-containing protein [Candidatus Omnitrophota bacterium]
MAEQQKNKTLTISGEATCKIQGSIGPPVSVLVREISVVGVKFVTTQKIPPNTPLEMSIRVTDDSDAIIVTGKVAWQADDETSRFLVDTYVVFTDLSAKNEGRLLNYITRSADSIKADRLHVRAPMISLVRYAKADSPDKKNDAFSGDIGVEGMKLFTNEDIPIDVELNVSFNLPHGRGMVSTRAKVVWIDKTSKGVSPIGIKFLDIQANDQKRILRYINYTLTQDVAE